MLGLEVECSELFEMTPTDEGMCCSFNMMAAEEMYAASEYQQIIAELQNRKERKNCHTFFLKIPTATNASLR